MILKIENSILYTLRLDRFLEFDCPGPPLEVEVAKTDWFRILIFPPFFLFFCTSNYDLNRTRLYCKKSWRLTYVSRSLEENERNMKVSLKESKHVTKQNKKWKFIHSTPLYQSLPIC